LTPDLSQAALFNVAGALLLAAVGVFVGSIRPRTLVNRRFALFAIGLGLALACNSLVVRDLTLLTSPLAVVLLAAGAPLFVLSAVGIVGLAALFPRPLSSSERRLALLAVLPALWVVLVPNLPAYLHWEIASGLYVDGQLVSVWTAAPTLAAALFLGGQAAGVALAAFWYCTFLFALRYHREPRQEYYLLSAALILLIAYVVGVEILRAWRHTGPLPFFTPAVFVGFLPPTLALSALWLRNVRISPRPAAARTVAWLPLAVALAAMAQILVEPRSLHGLARFASVLLLAYAIVRHQLLGIDVKVRWTISRGTIAAAFIAVFFVVSEAAQVVFGGEENPYVGIAAAGLLVFAIAPLQRAADRLAQAAVPASGSAVPPSDREETYRAAVRMALRGGISRDEERTLARLARDLGIDAHRAFEIREETERTDSRAPLA